MFFEERQKLEGVAKASRRAVIYARYSSEMQDTSDSIEVQLSECKKYALAQNIVLAREPFIDRAETGTSTENRKAYQTLMALAQTAGRDFNLILTYHTSRWGRGIESEIDEYLLEKAGIKIIAVSQPFTADEGVESFFMKGVLRKIDAYYSMQTGKYTHAYQTSNAQNGFKNGGAAPDGYAIEQIPTGKKDKHGREKMKSKLILDMKPGKNDSTSEPRHKLAEFVFMNAYRGKGIRWLSAEAYRLGWRSRYSNKRISAGTIRTWLMNPAYTGYMVWNRMKFFRTGGRRQHRHNPINKWVFSESPSHPAIISKEIFEAVANKFMDRTGKRGMTHPSTLGVTGSHNRGKFLLSGLMKCSLCGASYVAAKNIHRGKRTQVYYVCTTKSRYGKDKCPNDNINMIVADGATLEAICDVLLTEGEIKKFIEAFNEFADDLGEKSGVIRDRIRKDRAKVERELSNIKRAIVAGADSRSFTQELQERQEMLDRMDLELASLGVVANGEKITYNSAKLAAWVQTVRNNLLSADFDTLREMVRKFVKGIVVQPDKRAEMTWDPQAVLSLADGPRVPATAMMVIKNGCGGWI